MDSELLVAFFSPVIKLPECRRNEKPRPLSIRWDNPVDPKLNDSALKNNRHEYIASQDSRSCEIYSQNSQAFLLKISNDTLHRIQATKRNSHAWNRLNLSINTGQPEPFLSNRQEMGKLPKRY